MSRTKPLVTSTATSDEVRDLLAFRHQARTVYARDNGCAIYLTHNHHGLYVVETPDGTRSLTTAEGAIDEFKAAGGRLVALSIPENDAIDKFVQVAEKAKEAGHSFTDMARAIGCTPPAVSHYMSGRRRPPAEAIEAVRKMAGSSP